MRVAELDDVTYDLEVDGDEVRRTLHRRVWERRGWATVAIVFEEQAQGGIWKAPKLALIRFQRSQGGWRRHATITLTGTDAAALADSLASWRPALLGDGDGDDDAGNPAGDE
jgi:hypothetical protein